MAEGTAYEARRSIVYQVELQNVPVPEWQEFRKLGEQQFQSDWETLEHYTLSLEKYKKLDMQADGGDGSKEERDRARQEAQEIDCELDHMRQRRGKELPSLQSAAVFLKQYRHCWDGARRQ